MAASAGMSLIRMKRLVKSTYLFSFHVFRLDALEPCEINVKHLACFTPPGRLDLLRCLCQLQSSCAVQGTKASEAPTAP